MKISRAQVQIVVFFCIGFALPFIITFLGPDIDSAPPFYVSLILITWGPAELIPRLVSTNWVLFLLGTFWGFIAVIIGWFCDELRKRLTKTKK
jgi:hypothetical protein